MMISIELSRQFKKLVRDAGRETEVSATLKLVREGFGNPHAHTGLAIRKVGNRLYECRTGLAWRLIFEAQKGALVFDFAGVTTAYKATCGTNAKKSAYRGGSLFPDPRVTEGRLRLGEHTRPRVSPSAPSPMASPNPIGSGGEAKMGPARARVLP
jgi:hypothetical protein